MAFFIHQPDCALFCMQQVDCADDHLLQQCGQVKLGAHGLDKVEQRGQASIVAPQRREFFIALPQAFGVFH
jgi:hypothetical protein